MSVILGTTEINCFVVAILPRILMLWTTKSWSHISQFTVNFPVDSEAVWDRRDDTTPEDSIAWYLWPLASIQTIRKCYCTRDSPGPCNRASKVLLRRRSGINDAGAIAPCGASSLSAASLHPFLHHPLLPIERRIPAPCLAQLSILYEYQLVSTLGTYVASSGSHRMSYRANSSGMPATQHSTVLVESPTFRGMVLLLVVNGSCATEYPEDRKRDVSPLEEGAFSVSHCAMTYCQTGHDYLVHRAAHWSHLPRGGPDYVSEERIAEPHIFHCCGERRQ